MSRPNLALLARCTVALGVAVAILCALQLVRTRQLQEQSAEMARFNVKRQALASLLAESLQYGQKNPAINPILSAVGLTLAPEGAGTGNTATSVPPSAPSSAPSSPVAKPVRKPSTR
jgi:hypothetical protein